MKIMNKLSFILILTMLIVSNQSNAQVFFGIDYESDNQRYIVSLKSNQTIATPLNSTSTAQVTIKFPSSDSFQIGNLTSLISNVTWNKTVRVNQPIEAMNYDYITFGLSSLGTSSIFYEKDSIVPLFYFENIGETCPGELKLVDNQLDNFLYPNSEKLSIKNYISILGAGGNAFIGIYQNDADCRMPLTTAVHTQEISEEIELFPNPATDWLMLNYKIATANPTELIICDVLGKTVYSQNLKESKGQHQTALDITHLAEGTYFLKLIGQKYQSKTFSFIKLR